MAEIEIRTRVCVQQNQTKTIEIKQKLWWQLALMDWIISASNKKQQKIFSVTLALIMSFNEFTINQLLLIACRMYRNFVYSTLSNYMYSTTCLISLFNFPSFLLTQPKMTIGIKKSIHLCSTFSLIPISKLHYQLLPKSYISHEKVSNIKLNFFN